MIGKIPFDTLVKDAIDQGVSIVYFNDSVADNAIKVSFGRLNERMDV